MVEGGLAELHTHLGGAVASEILWSLAHEQGIALPVKDYWEFDRLVTVSGPRGVDSLEALDRIYHWTELIQSSPIAVERSVHATIGGAYRSQGITTLEVRFNPMKRNRGGERDLDHIILAAIRGLDRASLEYPQVNAGLILMMDRTFTAEMNAVIVAKAIRWAPRGICGIDVAGPRPRGERYPYRELHPLVESADEGARVGGGRARHLPDIHGQRRPLHDRDGRPRDDADAPARRIRAPRSDRRPGARAAAGRKRARTRGLVRSARAGAASGVGSG